MRTPIEIRNDAIECVRLADQAKQRGHKAVLLLMAQGWASLAQELELLQQSRDEQPAKSPALQG
jgi:hypothetical protein